MEVSSNLCLTEPFGSAVCQHEKHKCAREDLMRGKFATNLNDEQTQMNSLNHQNPFNLNFDPLSERQKQKHSMEEAQRRRNYQIIRRTMETKELKTRGIERIKQENRDEKFKLPPFLKISSFSSCSDNSSTLLQPITSDSINNDIKSKCRAVSVMDKPEVKAMAQRHLRRKEEKLRQRIHDERERDERLMMENEKKEKIERENFLFRIANEDCSPSITANASVTLSKGAQTSDKFDYTLNELESHELRGLVEMEKSKSIEIPCGQKIKNQIVLRSFHDRTHTEPRGRSNLHRMSHAKKEKLEPPRGKVFSSINRICDPNDYEISIFRNDNRIDEKADQRCESIAGPIRHRMREIDEKLKQTKTRKESKNQREMNVTQRIKYTRTQPPQYTVKNDKKCALKSIVEEVSRNDRRTDKLSSKDKHLNVKFELEAKNPILDSLALMDMNNVDVVSKHNGGGDSHMMENECEESKVTSMTSTKSQPHGYNLGVLNSDKSLAWIQHETTAIKAKLQSDLGENRKSCETIEMDMEDDGGIVRGMEDNLSVIRRTFLNTIASKLRDYNDLDVSTFDNDEAESEGNELQSMESASTLSSAGTYFSQDSGSFIALANGEKIPYSRMSGGKKFQNKSLLTTEEKSAVYDEPYFITNNLNFMKRLLKPSDRFHTHRTRSCANIRERVKVELSEHEDEIIGCHVSKLATDIDELYIKEFYDEPVRKQYRFKLISEIEKLRNGLRMRISAHYIHEKLVLEQINAENDARIMQEMEVQINVYNNFLATCQETTHRGTMKILQEIKNYYQDTDKLRDKCNQLQSHVEPMRMKIVFLGNHFVRRTRFQDFQYLIKPIEWRIQHDNLHSIDGKLENFLISIEHRETKNLWNRDNVTVNTIMQFINDDNNMKIYGQKLMPFESGRDLLIAIKNLQSKSFKALEKFTYAGITLKKLQNEIEKSREMNRVFLSRYDSTMKSLKKRWTVVRVRFDDVRENVKSMVGKEMEASYGSLLQQIHADCLVFFKDTFYRNAKNDKNLKYFTTIEKFMLIEKKVLDLFTTIEDIPKSLINEIEKNVREEKKTKLRIAQRARETEQNIDSTMTQLNRLLAPPQKHIKREGKLPRSVLQRKKTQVIKEIPLLDPLEQKYLQAFVETSNENVDGEKLDASVKVLIQKIKNESIPFYLDQFLKKLDIKVNKLDAKREEEIYEEEELHFKFKEVMPQVRKQVQLWEKIREKEKNANIKKTLYLYEKK